MTLGFGGQHIIVIPELDLVSVITSSLPGVSGCNQLTTTGTFSSRPS